MEKELSSIEWQFKKLNRIAKVLPLSMFYNVSIDEYSINLQGYYSKDTGVLVKKYYKHIVIDGNGFISINKNGIHITLTPK